jgi:hypothetical protein
MNEAVLRELQAMRVELAMLIEEQQHLSRRLLASEDRRALGELLPAIAALVGDRAWTVAELYRTALAADDGFAALLELLAQWSTEDGGRRALGRLLARCDGVTTAGHRLVRVGRGAEAVWCVRACRFPGG